VSPVGQAERVTQNRVIALFREELSYRYLGDWSDRDGNSNIEEDLLTAHLIKAGYSAAQISAAIYKLRTEADNPGRKLYDNTLSLRLIGTPAPKRPQDHHQGAAHRSRVL
jgi:type I restriction enzyme R subunit